MDSPRSKPDDKSQDFEAMEPYWQKVADIMEGQDAIIKAGTKYLPQFPKEPTANYKFRLSVARFTNIFRDIIEGLSAKPFAKELKTGHSTPEAFEPLIEDIDGRGNHLHVFAADVFFWGVSNAIEWILVDYTNTGGSRTVAEEREAGARPYWVHIPAIKVIWVESAFISGIEVLTLVKIQEAEGKVRTFERSEAGVTWRVEKEGDDGEWFVVDQGRLTIGVIPMVPFITGHRKGSKWQFHPPMRDAADMQITLYQNESNLEYIKTMTCFPMLSGNGVNPPLDEGGNQIPVPVGPQAVLYAPPNSDGSHGEWVWIEPNAQSLTFVSKEVDQLKRDLREIGRQPLTAQSANLTVITTAFAAQKGNSVVQAWALRLKDSLELALKYTAMWMGQSVEPEVSIYTDFALLENDDNAVDNLVRLRTAEEPQISIQTLWEELQRRNVLSPEFNADEELLRLLGASPDDDNQP